MEKNLSNSEIVICTSEDGKVTLDTKLDVSAKLKM